MADRLSVLSFVIQAGIGEPGSPQRFLHHNFVVAVLNDLFGIQARGGCSCAGPYGHRLLGIEPEQSLAFEREIDRGCEGIKPGWTRVNLNYFISDEEADYIGAAIVLIAEHADSILPLYNFEPDSGMWRHRHGPIEPPSSLHDIVYDGGSMSYRRHVATSATSLSGHLAATREFIAELAEQPGDQFEPGTMPSRLPTNDDFERLRWFPYPDESLRFNHREALPDGAGG